MARLYVEWRRYEAECKGLARLGRAGCRCVKREFPGMRCQEAKIKICSAAQDALTFCMEFLLLPNVNVDDLQKITPRIAQLDAIYHEESQHHLLYR